MASNSLDGPIWAVTVSVPASISDSYMESLFSAIADVAHDWEDSHEHTGWDIDVSAGLVGTPLLNIELTADITINEPLQEMP